MTTENPNKQSLQELIRNEVRNSEYDKYILQLITGTNLESRVKTLTQEEYENIRTKIESRVNSILGDFKEKMRDQIDRLVPESAKAKVQSYLNEHLEGRVNTLVSRFLPSILPAIVKGEMLERLAALSGVDQLIKEHKMTIDAANAEYRNNLSEMFQQEAEFNSQQRAIQMARIKELTDGSVQEFSTRALNITNDIVNQLVDTNGGMIIRSFATKLESGNNEHFIKLSAALESKLKEMRDTQKAHERELTLVQSSLYWQKWFNAILALGLGSMIGLRIKDSL